MEADRPAQFDRRELAVVNSLIRSLPSTDITLPPFTYLSGGPHAPQRVLRPC